MRLPQNKQTVTILVRLSSILSVTYARTQQARISRMATEVVDANDVNIFTLKNNLTHCKLALVQQ